MSLLISEVAAYELAPRIGSVKVIALSTEQAQRLHETSRVQGIQ
jgi:hypothetical protein